MTNTPVQEPPANALDLLPIDLPNPGDSKIMRVMEHVFSPEWYERTYHDDIALLGRPGERTFDFYLRIGARRGHDPSEAFSEILYRAHNIDVRKHLVDNTRYFGFWHFLEHGIHEHGRVPFDHKAVSNARKLVAALDREFLLKNYGDQALMYPDIVDFYFDRVRAEAISPCSEFSEAGYRELNPDIELEVISGNIRSGFEHFLLTRGQEKRTVISHDGYLTRSRRSTEAAVEAETRMALETNAPGITHAVALDVLRAMEFFDSPINLTVTSARGRRGLLVLVPQFLPELLFGGYMAFYDFLAKLKQETGVSLHLLVVNMSDAGTHAGNMLRMRLKMPSVRRLFDRIDRFDSDERRIEISGDFNVVSYCGELHPMATRVASQLGRKPIFFIQEYEPDFHANGDMRSFIERSFLLPHHAVYNSTKLVEFFQTRTCVFSHAGSEYRYASIENAIAEMPMDRDAFLARQREKTVGRLIIYGRPEGYASRNCLATIVFSLRRAIQEKIFSEKAWEFFSVGALSLREDIDLHGKTKLRMLPKMSKAEYEGFLLSGDIGVSVITTPHPGIVHFQMAAFGLATVTNRTELRGDAWLLEQNRNLVPVDMSVESIMDGFRKAVLRSHDLESRYNNAIHANRPDERESLRSALDLMTLLLER